MPNFTYIGGPVGTPVGSGTGDSPDSPSLTWLDLDLGDAADRAWLAGWDGIGPPTRELLLAPVRLQHREHLADGMLVSLRALRSDAVDDLADLKLLIRPGLALTVRDGPVAAVDALREELATGAGRLVSAVDLLAVIVAGMTRRMEVPIDGIVQQTDTLEDQWLDQGTLPTLDELHDLRRRIFRARRRLGGVRQVLVPITTDPAVALEPDDRATLSRSAEHLSRYIDGLEECAGRLRLLAEQIDARRAAAMTRASMNLSIVATVFLPLTFMSGLLGMNVAGIPEAHDPFGFWVVSGLSVLFAAVLWVVLHQRIRY